MNFLGEAHDVTVEAGVLGLKLEELGTVKSCCQSIAERTLYLYRFDLTAGAGKSKIITLLSGHRSVCLKK